MTDFYRTAFGLVKPFWIAALTATVVGALSGVATMWLLGIVNRGLHSASGFGVAMIAQFAGLCVISVGGSALSGIANTSVGQKIILALRKDVAGRISRMPLAEIERYSGYRLLAIVTTDIDMVSAFALQFPGILIAWATALGSFGYLLMLSRTAFALCAAAATVGIAAGYLGQKHWMADYEAARGAEDELRKHYRAITEGAKELRLNRKRRARVHDVLLSEAAERIACLRSVAMRRLWGVDAVIGTFYFAAIGTLLAVSRTLGISADALSGAVLVMLFARGSVEQIVASLSVLATARTSFLRIAAASAALEPASTKWTESSGAIAEWSEIELRDVQHQFDGADKIAPFVLGPLRIRIRRGETVFIVGENGSGKTTLVKLLLGLYMPQQGSLLVDHRPVPESCLDDYRQMFSAVFSDYFLFEELLGGASSVSRRAREVLERLAIARKVRVECDRFTTTELSTGERKRLALVHALIENRPVMMFDEWPADQDPTFRRIFYTELLPELRRAGKTLIVVSHDDRYFKVANRIVRMVSGKIISDAQVADEDRLVALT